MTQISATSSAGDAAAKVGSNDLRNVDMDQFLNLLLAEMQNQDPMNPMENSEMLQQISQIREIGATNKLSDTLDSVLTGQNLTTASGIIGKNINALSDHNVDVSGTVDRVTVESNPDGEGKILRVHVGEHQISLDNIRDIRSKGTADQTDSP